MINSINDNNINNNNKVIIVEIMVIVIERTKIIIIIIILKVKTKPTSQSHHQLEAKRLVPLEILRGKGATAGNSIASLDC